LFPETNLVGDILEPLLVLAPGVAEGRQAAHADRADNVRQPIAVNVQPGEGLARVADALRRFRQQRRIVAELVAEVGVEPTIGSEQRGTARTIVVREGGAPAAGVFREAPFL